MAATPPVIQPGKKLTFTSRPFLGGKRVNFIIALFNALVNLRVKVVSAVGTTGSAPSALNNINPGFSFDSQGNGLLTIPVSTQSTAQQGWFWTAGCRNYDESHTFQEQQVVYISPTSTAATSGLLDAATLATVKSAPGIYVCLQANAPVLISGTTYYRVPQIPMPVPGDMDNSDNYWVMISQEPQCI